MRALAVSRTEREVRLVDHPRPRLAAPDDVLFRVLEVGICGTDREIAAFTYGTPPPDSPYLILGHEALGEVVEVGASVSRFAPGDLVVPMVRRPCPHAECRACAAGRQDFCYTGDYREAGIKEKHGFLTEFAVEEERSLVPVPKDLRDVAVLAEPLSIAEKAIAQVWQVQGRLPWLAPGSPETGYGHRAVVLGTGPVGLLGAMVLVRAGFDTTVYSRPPKDGGVRIAWIESIGARFVSTESCPPDHLADTGGRVDLVYEATGAAAFSFDVMRALDANAVFVFTGVPGRRERLELEAGTIMRNLVLKNQIFFGTVNAAMEHLEAAVRDLGSFRRRWPEAVRTLITGRHALAGFGPLLSDKGAAIKEVIEPLR